jgi:ABC-type uncharacterized transport system permease subunit
MLGRGKPHWGVDWRPAVRRALVATTALRVAGINIPMDVVQVLPFAMVILVLLIFARNSVLRPALGLHYIRGEC